MLINSIKIHWKIQALASGQHWQEAFDNSRNWTIILPQDTFSDRPIQILKALFSLACHEKRHLKS